MTSPRPSRAAVAAATALLGVALGTAPARAQIPGVSPFSFGVEAGPAFPVSSFGNQAGAGFGADALVEAHLPLFPVGLRFEGGVAQFGGKNGLGSARVISGSADAVLRLSPVALSLVRPYLIGGVGVYNRNQGVGTAVGFNVGGGLSLPLALVTPFADLRYTTASTNGVRTSFVPLRVGVRF